MKVYVVRVYEDVYVFANEDAARKYVESVGQSEERILEEELHFTEDVDFRVDDVA